MYIKEIFYQSDVQILAIIDQCHIHQVEYSIEEPSKRSNCRYLILRYPAKRGILLVEEGWARYWRRYETAELDISLRGYALFPAVLPVTFTFLPRSSHD